jgi:peroxiredoxin (alkyl hydroperoxide reductase subunit C)
MKKILIIILLALFAANQLFSQDNKEIRIPLIGETAPSFTAESTNGKITFPDDYYGKGRSFSAIQLHLRRSVPQS